MSNIFRQHTAAKHIYSDILQEFIDTALPCSGYTIVYPGQGQHTLVTLDQELARRDFSNRSRIKILSKREVHSCRKQLRSLLGFSSKTVDNPRLCVAELLCGFQQQLLTFHKMYNKRLLQLFGLQLAWLVVLTVAGNIFWTCAVKKVTVNGGWYAQKRTWILCKYLPQDTDTGP